ncbi:DUF721 domain-containing protein [uncultured Fusobacterium sp.]|uniref:DUF721 domain-containing protein n=1 Tax=uncultured Fusobacterium sp. TaxID=159267 RepID=UPI0025FF1318|nr:DUF721 domain-containing protein [uncultured Fusobacterium sp.]
MAEKLSNVSEMIDVAVGKSRRLKEGILKADWEKIVGKICEKCQPDYIKDGILYIKAEGNIFIHHLTLEKTNYINKINSYFKENVIKDIIIKTGKLDENREEYLNHEVKKEKKEENTSILEKEQVNLNILEKIAYLQKIAIEREEYLLSQGFKKCKICGMLFEGEEEFCRVCLDNGNAKKYLKSHEQQNKGEK